MPRKGKYVTWWKRSEAVPLVICLFVSGPLVGQKGEIVMLSEKVGTVLDAEEKEILGLFPRIDGFQSAQFTDLGEGRYRVRIVVVDHTRTRVLTRTINWPQFFHMKRIADAHPEITEEMRREHREKLAYLRVHRMVEQIPPSTFCTIRHSSGRRISGSFVGYEEGVITFQSPTRRIRFPVDELESITYRPYIDDGNRVKKALSFALGAAVGLGVGELWNIQSRPSVDLTWHNRFSGAVLGLVSGSELFEAVTILTSPRKFIAFTPENVNNK